MKAQQARSARSHGLRTVAQAMPEEDEQMTGVVFNSCALQGGRQQPALANTVSQPQVSNKRKEPPLVTW